MKAPLAPSSQFYYVDTKSFSNERNLENKQDQHQQQYHHVSTSPPSSPPPPHVMSKPDSPFSPDATKTTASLMKFIGDVTIKRRHIRRKFRCGNLLAEAVLSNALREAKKELQRKQEEKRRNLQSFTYNVTINYSSADQFNSNNNYHLGENSDSNNDTNSFVSCKDLVLDSTLQNCLSSLDSFFNELKEIKT